MAGMTKNRQKRLIFIAVSKLRIADGSGFVKGTTKLYFTHYSCVVIVLFNTGWFAFSTISFRKLVFRFCAFCDFCFELNVLNQDIKICVIFI